MRTCHGKPISHLSWQQCQTSELSVAGGSPLWINAIITLSSVCLSYLPCCRLRRDRGILKQGQEGERARNRPWGLRKERNKWNGGEGGRVEGRKSLRRVQGVERTKLKSEQGGIFFGGGIGEPFGFNQGFCICTKRRDLCIIYNSSLKGNIISLRKTESVAYIHVRNTSPFLLRSQDGAGKIPERPGCSKNRRGRRMSLCLCFYRCPADVISPSRCDITCQSKSFLCTDRPYMSLNHDAFVPQKVKRLDMSFKGFKLMQWSPPPPFMVDLFLVQHPLSMLPTFVFSSLSLKPLHFTYYTIRSSHHQTC